MVLHSEAPLGIVRASGNCMQDKAIDRGIPMVIFMTVVILAGLVTAGRDETAAARVRHWFAGDSQPMVIRSK
jgi:hypothetical protein